MLTQKKLEIPLQNAKLIKHRRTHSKSFQNTDETIATTKEKTYATIEQTKEFNDHRYTQKSTHFSSRREYLDHMQACQLSPFSSPERQQSPRLSGFRDQKAVALKDTTKKKKKESREKQTISRTTKVKQKKEKKCKANKKSECLKIRADFKNQFLKRMNITQNQKRITQLSEQELESSIRKNYREQIKQFPSKVNKESFVQKNQSCLSVHSYLHENIKQKHQKIYPHLSSKEHQILSAIVFVQQMWRQKKVKNMINSIIDPQKQSQVVQTLNLKPLREKQMTKKDITQEKQTQQILEKENFQIIQDNIQRTDNQNVKLPNKNQDAQLQNSVLQTSSEQEIYNQSKFINYVDSYRQLTLKQKSKKLKLKAKPNIFNIPQSLSQNCLLDKLYRKTYSHKNPKQVSQKQKKSVKKLMFPIRLRINQNSVPQNQLQVQERCGTQLEQNSCYQSLKKIQQKTIKPQQHTVGTIASVSQSIIESLIVDFSQQFLSFTQKKCLKKKRKTPGIKITTQTIQKYLFSFNEYLQSSYKGYMTQSFSKITPRSFLKIFRTQLDDQIFELASCSNQQQIDDQFNWPILPQTAFFQYQPLYEQNIFEIQQKDKKYQNFLLGLIKIHNKCLADCLAERIQKKRVDQLIFPWETHRRCPIIPIKKQFLLQPIISDIAKSSITNLGQITKYQDVQAQEKKLLKSLDKEYKEQGKQWQPYSQRLQMRLELVESVFDELWCQATKQIKQIFL